VQYELLKLLAGEAGMFTAVGDDDQSIYGWRGATLDNLKRLPADYPALKVIPLEQNYRSTGSILRAANAVIGNNPKLYEKKLWSELGERRAGAHDRVRRRGARGRARGRAHRVDPAARGSDAELRDFACCTGQPPGQGVRAGAAQGRHSLQGLGRQSFFDRAEIRDLCAWLRLIVNSDDDPAFLRAATGPSAASATRRSPSLGAFAGRWKASLFEALFADDARHALPKRSIETLHEFGRTSTSSSGARARPPARRRRAPSCSAG
jgi:ATP-dependent DNA helicase Rep